MTANETRARRWVTASHERALRGAGTSVQIGRALKYDPSSVRAMWSGDPGRLHPDLRRVLELGLGLTRAGCDVRPLAVELWMAANRRTLLEALDEDVLEYAVLGIDGENEADALEDSCPAGTPVHARYLYRAGLACLRAHDGIMEATYRGLPVPDRWATQAAARLEALR